MFLFIKYTLRDPDPARTTMFVMLPAIGAAVLSSIPSGMLSDRIGRRKLIFISQFLMAVGALGFAIAPNLTFAYIAGIPAGLAYGVFTAVEWALACNLLPAGDTARYLGIWNASAVVPQIIGFLVAGAVGSAISAYTPGLGWRMDFVIAIICCLAGAYFLIFVKERLPRQDTTTTSETTT
jgi:MFS family permease